MRKPAVLSRAIERRPIVLQPRAVMSHVFVELCRLRVGPFVTLAHQHHINQHIHHRSLTPQNLELAHEGSPAVSQSHNAMSGRHHYQGQALSQQPSACLMLLTCCLRLGRYSAHSCRSLMLLCALMLVCLLLSACSSILHSSAPSPHLHCTRPLHLFIRTAFICPVS